MYKVVFYKDRNGKEHLKDYIYDLVKKGKSNKNERIQAEKILASIKLLAIYGVKVGMPKVKHIDGEIWELRPLKHRIFFFYWEKDKFVLLHHYIKKTQKAPKREIERAKNNLISFLERSEENGED